MKLNKKLSISLEDFGAPKQLIEEKVNINGVDLIIGRAVGSTRLPKKFKSLF